MEHHARPLTRRGEIGKGLWCCLVAGPQRQAWARGAGLATGGPVPLISVAADQAHQPALDIHLIGSEDTSLVSRIGGLESD
jgi:hypothetical protein